MLTTNDIIIELNQLDALKQQRNKERMPYDTQIKALEGQALEATKDLNTQITEKEKSITASVLAIHSSVRSKSLNAVYTGPYVTRSWDLDGLDNLANTHPDVWTVIQRYRKENPQGNTVKIKELNK